MGTTDSIHVFCLGEKQRDAESLSEADWRFQLLDKVLDSDGSFTLWSSSGVHHELQAMSSKIGQTQTQTLIKTTK